MRYRWDDFMLDREAMVLARQGTQIAVSRKVLDCIHHLIENQGRVVSYDELIRRIWGHDNINNHQLSQVILAARRTLGDDGHAQRLIRTAPGLGYRWVGTLVVDPIAPPGIPEDTHVAELATPVVIETKEKRSPSEQLTPPPALPANTGPAHHPDPVAAPPAAAPIPATVSSVRRRGWLGWAAAAAVVVGSVGSLIFVSRETTGDRKASGAARGTSTVSAIAHLRNRLDSGAYEDVRLGLATLPPAVAGSPEARLLEIELDLERGRVEAALEKIVQEEKLAQASRDTILRAHVYILKSKILQKRGGDPAGSLAAAQAALDLLKAIDGNVPSADISAALGARAGALMLKGNFDDAMRDYVRARDIALSVGDTRLATTFRANLARAWMRVGRLSEAYEELEMVLKDATASGNIVEQVFTLNTMSRIQVELLRWDDALATNDRVLELLRRIPGSDRRPRALALRAYILSAKGRLHEANAQLEESRYLLPNRADEPSPMINAMHYLEIGEPSKAVKPIDYVFRNGPYPFDFNPMLEDAEGPLLAWTIAAGQTGSGRNSLPALPKMQLDQIGRPRTATGHIARGRWLLLRGEPEAAEAELRLAMQETRRMGHLYRMTFAAEALVQLLLERGDVEGAQLVFDDLRATHPSMVDGDFRSSLIPLRIALARGDVTRSRHAYNKARSLASERELPQELAIRYKNLQTTSTRASGRISMWSTDLVSGY